MMMPMRALNIFTYAASAVVAVSYWMPAAYYPWCSVGVALMGLIVVPVAGLVRRRACEAVAQEERRAIAGLAVAARSPQGMHRATKAQSAD